jgi:hypothetical protein
VYADLSATWKYWPCKRRTASLPFVTYTAIDPYALSESFRLSYDTLAIFTSFSFSNISTTPARS